MPPLLEMNEYLNTLRSPVIFILVLLEDCIISKCTRKVKKIVKAKKDWGKGRCLREVSQECGERFHQVELESIIA